MSVESQIEELKEIVLKGHEDMKDIKKVLAGDDYGNDGLVQQHKDLKERFYETREQVRKIWIIGGLLSAIFGGLLSLVSFFNDIFGE